MAPSFDEIEDLTRFADESFDTDEVDLFEFTGVDDSPLTRLKSIILSLDWEISDDILDELVQEVASLQSMWQEDKVAQVYLQGLEKIGNYLRREGAYAHQNAIKLLLTLFYNYEKIISSPDISGETITSLLKSDIRKFKVLQYQISMLGPTAADTANQAILVTKEKEISADENDPLTNIEATILGLEWEVTNEGLEQFNQQADELREYLPDDKPSEVLLKGLQSLGAYVNEEKINAHPDAFTLLHSFYDGLKILATDKDIDTEKRQEILIDRVSRLNNLKEIIAAANTVEPDDRTLDEVDRLLDFADDDNVVEDQPASKQEIEEEMDIARGDQKSADNINAAMETADEQYPDDVLDPDAIQPVSDELADDFIEEELKLSTNFTSALDTISEETTELSMEDEDLEEELDLLFVNDKADNVENEDLELNLDDESGDLTPALEVELADVDQKNGESLNFDEDLFLVEDDEDKGLPAGDEDPEDLEEELDLLFVNDKADNVENEDLELNLDDESGDLTPALEVELADVDQKNGESLNFDEDLFLVEDDEDKGLPAGDEDFVTPALAEADEQLVFREDVETAGLAEDPTAELADKLDSFFGISEDEADIDLEPVAPSTQQVDRGTEDIVVSALTDADEDIGGGFREEEVAAELIEDSSDDLQDKLDSFFGSDDKPETEVTAALESKTGAEEPLEEKIDSFFTEDEASEADQKLSKTEPALADADEISEFEEQDAVAGLADSAIEESNDKLDSFFEEHREKNALKAPTSTTALATLASVTSTLSASPAPDDFKLVAELVADGKEENIGAPQTVLLTLLDSAVDLLSKNPEIAVENNAIIQELVAGLEDAENPATLTEMVQRYTSWQQTFFETIISSQKSTVTTAPSPAVEGENDDVTLQMQAGFSQLREAMMKEFDNIRNELKQE